MLVKLKNFLNKIKPLNYEDNPIGSLKLELFFWMLIGVTVSYISGNFIGLIRILEGVNYFSMYYVFVIIMIIGWCRLSIKISRYLKVKRRFKKNKNENEFVEDYQI